jgi:hypothetical protein
VLLGNAVRVLGRAGHHVMHEWAGGRRRYWSWCGERCITFESGGGPDRPETAVNFGVSIVGDRPGELRRLARCKSLTDAVRIALLRERLFRRDGCLVRVVLRYSGRGLKKSLVVYSSSGRFETADRTGLGLGLAVLDGGPCEALLDWLAENAPAAFAGHLLKATIDPGLIRRPPEVLEP